MNDPITRKISLSVIVPFYNAMPNLAACAASLRRQRERFPEAEVLFADAASTDDSGAFLAAHFPEFRLVRAASRNAYAARNRAAESARGTILAFTDADCSVEPAWLSSIRRAVEHGADLVTGPVDAPAGVSSALRGVHAYENRRMAEMCRSGGRSINYAYTNNLAMRAELFRSMGGFDESQSRGGDSALVLRALAGGLATMVYADGMRVVHLEVSTLRRWWLKKFLYGRSRTARRTGPSVVAYRSARIGGGDTATLAALGVGRLFYEAGSLAGWIDRRRTPSG